MCVSLPNSCCSIFCKPNRSTTLVVPEPGNYCRDPWRPRSNRGYPGKLKQFSNLHRCTIPFPLFWPGDHRAGRYSCCRTILYKNIRLCGLLSVRDQAVRVWRLKTEELFMYGFSLRSTCRRGGLIRGAQGRKSS
ncbi:hypothetical protein BD779DRAFT_516574 [Infundibulicybe gibba]|nr:hypothetical protein BD779DRAFT_516574 [Infundibulicybe gibba]